MAESTSQIKNKYWDIFNVQKANQFNIGNMSFKERIKKLDTLKHAVEITYRKRIQQALIR